jgi:hypothetical protein
MLYRNAFALALRWQRIFVQVVQSMCPPQMGHRTIGEKLADLPSKRHSITYDIFPQILWHRQPRLPSTYNSINY